MLNSKVVKNDDVLAYETGFFAYLMMKKNEHSREFPCRESSPGHGSENARS